MPLGASPMIELPICATRGCTACAIPQEHPMASLSIWGNNLGNTSATGAKIVRPFNYLRATFESHQHPTESRARARSS